MADNSILNLKKNSQIDKKRVMYNVKRITPYSRQAGFGIGSRTVFFFGQVRLQTDDDNA